MHSDWFNVKQHYQSWNVGLRTTVNFIPPNPTRRTPSPSKYLVKAVFTLFDKDNSNLRFLFVQIGKKSQIIVKIIPLADGCDIGLGTGTAILCPLYLSVDWLTGKVDFTH